jgi:hypothetical protein
MVGAYSLPMIQNRPTPESLQKFAGLQRLTPYDPACRYVRFVAIGNLEVDGFNLNHDGFPYEYFEDSRPGFGYRSFVGKRAHVEHDTGHIGKSIGSLVDSYLNAFVLPEKFRGQKYADLDSWQVPERQEVLTAEGQRDGTIEVLMQVDSKLLRTADIPETHRRLVAHVLRILDTGQPVFCSMGMNLSYSDCTICGNRATVEADYCNHLQKIGGRRGGLLSVGANQVRDLIDQQHMRPEWLPHVLHRQSDVREVLFGASNRAVMVKVAEINHEHSFFELSIVGSAAFPKAVAKEVVASRKLYGVDWEKLSNKELLALYDGLVN